jgi:hypothetical protein
MKSHSIQFPLVCSALLVCFACLLTGCKPDNPAPSTTGYYDGPMKAKATNSTKTTDNAGSKPRNNMGTP